MKKQYILVCMIVLQFCIACAEKVDCKLPEEVTYSGQIATLVEEKCFMCHAPEVYKTKASRMKIFDYKSLKKAAEEGLLMGSITHQKGFIAMPYRKGKKIDTCSIALFDKWVAGGMKE